MGIASFFQIPFFKRIASRKKYVVMGKNPYTKKNMDILNKDTYDSYRKIFKSNNIENIVFFSNCLDGSEELGNEEENLRLILNLSIEMNVKNFVYVITNSDLKVKNESTDNKINSFNDITHTSCEMMLKLVTRENDINVVCLKVPYLLTYGKKMCQVERWLDEARMKESITFIESKTKRTDFLDESDLSNLIKKICGKEDSGYKCFYIDGDNMMTYNKLRKKYVEFVGEELDVVIRENKECKYDIPIAVKEVYSDSQSLALQEHYGWIASGKYKFGSYIKKMYKVQNKQIKKLKKRDNKTVDIKAYEVSNKDKKKKRRYKTCIRLIEVLLICALAEVIGYYIKKHFNIKDVDIRVFYVTIIGVVYGSGMGCIAAIIAIVSYIFKKDLYQNIDVLIHNLNIWCNLVVYLLAGIVAGFFTRKREDKIRVIKKEYENLSNSHGLLKELYNSAIEKKDEMARQIVGFDNSYGKMYEMIKRLAKSMPDEVIYEGISIMERFLDNKSIAVYRFDKDKKHARLIMASSEYKLCPKTINLDDYKLVVDVLEEDGFINRTCDDKLPSYVSPIKDEENIIGIILINETRYEDMNNEYANKFKIITGLINDALIRANEKHKTFLKKACYDDTKILKWDKFKEILDSKDKIKKEGLFDYHLEKIGAFNENKDNINKFISSYIREGDLVTKNENDQIYVLFNQASSDDCIQIKKRINDNN